MANEAIHVQIYRSPSNDSGDEIRGGEYQEYEVPYEDRMTDLRVLDYVFQHYDRSLAYYKSCRIGKCTGCLVSIDGKNKFACSTLVKDGIRVGPAAGFITIRDLVVIGSPQLTEAGGEKGVSTT